MQVRLKHAGLENDRFGQSHFRDGRQCDGIHRHRPIVVRDPEAYRLRHSGPEAQADGKIAVKPFEEQE